MFPRPTVLVPGTIALELAEIWPFPAVQIQGLLDRSRSRRAAELVIAGAASMAVGLGEAAESIAFAYSRRDDEAPPELVKDAAALPALLSLADRAGLMLQDPDKLDRSLSIAVGRALLLRLVFVTAREPVCQICGQVSGARTPHLRPSKPWRVKPGTRSEQLVRAAGSDPARPFPAGTPVCRRHPITIER